jgi:hypothetical protein
MQALANVLVYSQIELVATAFRPWKGVQSNKALA